MNVNTVLEGLFVCVWLLALGGQSELPRPHFSPPDLTFQFLVANMSGCELLVRPT
jgi:hypothetical protein